MPSLRKLFTKNIILIPAKQVLPVFLAILLFITSCASEPPSRFEDAQQQSQGNSAVVKEALPGSSFNKFFPPSGGGYERVYTQEKSGFAEAKLKQDNQDIALLSISDILNNPRAVNKFNESTEYLPGYPTIKFAKQGSGGSTILVADRFQVKVLSIDPNFTEDERKAWLTKFDINGLAALVK